MTLRIATIVEAGQAGEWLRTVLGVFVCLVCEFVFAAVDAGHVGWTVLPLLRLAHSSALAIVLGFLLSYRDRTTASGRVFAGLVAALPLIPVFWVEADELVNIPGNVNVDPFAGTRLAIVVAALLMPGPAWVGISVVGALALGALFHVAHEPRVFASQPLVGEPWLSIVHLAFAFAILALRGYTRRLEDQFISTRSSAVSARLIGDLRRAVGDAAFTPLQTIEANAFLLKKKHPEEQASADRLLRSTARLRELLDQLRADVPEKRDDLSFDTSEAVRERLRAIEPRPPERH